MKATKTYLHKLSLLVCMLFGLMTFSVNAAAYTTPDGLYSFTLSKGKAIINAYNGLASKITIPEKVQEKAGGKQYTVVYIGNGKTSILGTSADVKDVTIPATATKISANAFLNAQGLRSVTVGKKVSTIADNAFQGCKKLATVDLSGAAALKTIGDEVFVDCTSLTSFVCSPSVLSIGDAAFLGCTSLTSVQFSPVLTTIGDEAFYKCSSLASLTTSEQVPSFMQAKRHINYPADTVVAYFPASLEEIGFSAFYATGLTGVLYIPYKVQEIQENTFMSCKKLTGIYLTTGVETLGSNAFRNCTAVKDLFLPTTLSVIAENAFSGNTINNDRSSIYLFKKSEIDKFLNGTKQYDAYIFNYLDSNRFTFKDLVTKEGYTMSDTLNASKTTFWAGQTVDLNILFNKPLNTELSDQIKWEVKTIPASTAVEFAAKNQDSAVIASKAAKKQYTVMVKATVDDDHDASVNLTLMPSPTSVIINKKGYDPAGKYKVNLKKTSKIQLQAKTLPANGADLTWSSSDTSIATVNAAGLVTNVGNKEGTVTITAKTYNKVTATCQIQFYYSYQDVTKQYLINPNKDLDIAAGSAKTIVKTKLPAGTVFTSSNPSIATVDNNGKVVGIKPGVAKITALYSGDKATSTVARLQTLVYIVPKAQTITLQQLDNGVKVIWSKDKTVTGFELRYGKSTTYYSRVKTPLGPSKYTYLLKVLPKKKTSVVQIAGYMTYKGKKHYGKFATASIVAK